MVFSVDGRLFTLFPGLQIGVLVCEIENKRYGEDSLEAVLDEMRTGFQYEKPQDHPHIRVWREAFTKLGVSASKYYSSIESLLRRALKGGPFPRINPVVDLYNAVSLKYLLPMGGHAIPPLEGDISLCFAQGAESFAPMDGGEVENADEGEVVYKDDNEVLTRRWVWRQSNKDRVTVDTSSLFIPIDVMEGLETGLCERAMDEMDHGLAKNRYGRIVHRDIITRQNLWTKFSV